MPVSPKTATSVPGARRRPRRYFEDTRWGGRGRGRKNKTYPAPPPSKKKSSSPCACCPRLGRGAGAGLSWGAGSVPGPSGSPRGHRAAPRPRGIDAAPLEHSTGAGSSELGLRPAVCAARGTFPTSHHGILQPPDGVGIFFKVLFLLLLFAAVWLGQRVKC